MNRSFVGHGSAVAVRGVPAPGRAGARIFLSPKTVDHHLGNISRKPGLHSRRERILRLSASR